MLLIVWQLEFCVNLSQGCGIGMGIFTRAIYWSRYSINPLTSIVYSYQFPTILHSRCYVDRYSTSNVYVAPLNHYQYIDTRRHEQYGLHLQPTFSNAFWWDILFLFWPQLLPISLKCVFNDSFANQWALVKIMVWCQTGNRPLLTLMTTELRIDAYSLYQVQWIKGW